MLALDQVGKIYPNRVEALEAVSLMVEPDDAGRWLIQSADEP